VWLSARLVRAGVSANAISVAGGVLGVAGGALLLATQPLGEGGAARACWIAAAVCVQLRLLCNMMDGMVAVESGTASATGELYNEIPDRISDSATLVALGYAAGGSALLGWLAALLAMFTAYVRSVGKAAGARSHFTGPMAKQQRMALATLCALACGAGPAAWSAEPVALAKWTLAVIAAGSALTAVRRIRAIAADLRGGA
jgi:phosphatidylglycerophosphate synthase